ncbi:MAG: hypothetical protein BM556_00330 [Bacteriovorax sp. MedPE-SWde]|nr:MAG: hypothetical protein BM556_00330 [Bacteriovorax sp. MedPE-SWde]
MSSNRIFGHNFESSKNRAIKRAIYSSLVLTLSVVLIAFLVGRSFNGEDEQSVYGYRLFSRGFIQSSNALYDTQRLIEKHLRTKTFGDLEQSFIRAQSGKGIFLALVSEYNRSLNDVGDVSFSVPIFKSFDIIIKSLDALLLKLENGEAVSQIELERVIELSDGLIVRLLSEEAKSWHERAKGFSNAQKRSERIKITLAILVFLLIISSIVLGYFIIQRKNLEQNIEENRVRLMNGHRMSALGEFSASVAHEVNNPLSIILWRMNVIYRELKSGSNSDKLMTNLQSVETQARRIDKIIRGIKLLSNNSNNLDNEYYCLNQALEQLDDVICNKVELYNIDLQITPMNIPVVIYGKPVQLIQVFTNLLNNSIDAIKDMDDRWIKIEPWATNGMVDIKITDSGNGIKKSEQNAIFNLFYSSKKTEGTGIGLGLSAQMIKSLGGSLKYNHRSSNTQFLLKLPYSEFHLSKFQQQQALRSEKKGSSTVSL